MGISRQRALALLASDDLIGIGMEADALRRKLHPERVVTYVIERPLDCRLEDASVDRLAAETESNGGTGIVLECDPEAGPVPPLNAIERLIARLCRRPSGLSVHGLTATTILRLAHDAGLPPDEVLARLQAAGLAALGGGDSFLLDRSFRDQLSPMACNSTDWLAVHRAAHQRGLPSTVEIVFGAGESHADRVAHLEALGQLQAETAGFVALVPVAWSPRNPPPTHRALDEATAVDYLTTLAVSRLMLDSIANLGVSSQGLKVLQMALRFGANDAGPVLLDERAIQLAGPSNCATEEELRRIIRDAGLQPVERDALYRTMFLV
jgi:cyclic dehypoxanthinyl futalosine synthase